MEKKMKEREKKKHKMYKWATGTLSWTISLWLYVLSTLIWKSFLWEKEKSAAESTIIDNSLHNSFTYNTK